VYAAIRNIASAAPGIKHAASHRTALQPHPSHMKKEGVLEIYKERVAPRASMQ
jgi:hypothetical protein